MRAVCITCGQSRFVALKEIEGASGAVKAETCDDCHTYAKMLYRGETLEVDPFADDLATLGLDVLVAEAGWLATRPIRCCSSGRAAPARPFPAKRSDHDARSGSCPHDILAEESGS